MLNLVNMIRRVIVSATLVDVCLAVQLIHYTLNENLTVSAQHRASLLTAETFKVTSKYICLVQCNIDPACHTVSLEGGVDCTLFNNKTTLIATVNSSGTVLWSKSKLQMCPAGMYFEHGNKTCQMKRNVLENCSGLSENECIDMPGIGCLNGQCRCLNTSK